MSSHHAAGQVSYHDQSFGGALFPRGSRPLRVLWVDDSEVLLSLYRAVFESLGFEVVTTPSPAEALERLSWDPADLAILDYNMPEMDGGTLAAMIKSRTPVMPVILYTATTSVPRRARCWVDAICAKAAPQRELLEEVRRLLRKSPNRRPRSSQPLSTPQSAAA